MKPRLYRIQDGKMIGGVCTGLGEYFNIDPVLMRLLFIIILFISGVGLLAYIILWIVVPLQPAVKQSVHAASPGASQAENPDEQLPGSTQSQRDIRPGNATAGYLLIGIGVLLLLNNFIPSFSLRDYWPLLLIAIGGGILWHSTVRTTPDEVES
jgi:phage shock protein C